MYAQTLKRMEPAATVTITLKNGKKISGTPRSGPGSPEDGINELLLTHPEWWNGRTRTWDAEGAGAAAIVPLCEISDIALSQDPS